MADTTYASGARVIIRDAEWLIRRVDRTSAGGQALSVVGISELVREKEAIFLQEIENAVGSGIEILDPVETFSIPRRRRSWSGTQMVRCAC